MKKTAGFTALEVVIGLCIVGVLGLVGWRVVASRSTHTGQAAHKTTSTQKAAPKTTASATASDSQEQAGACATQAALDTNPDCLFYNLPEGVVSTVGQNTVAFKELGVQLVVPDSIKSLTYTLDTSHSNATYANVSIRSCTLGILVKVAGQATSGATNGSDDSYGQLVRQFADFYIAYTHPQSACSQSHTRSEVIQNINDVATFKEAVSSVSQL